MPVLDKLLRHAAVKGIPGVERWERERILRNGLDLCLAAPVQSLQNDDGIWPHCSKQEAERSGRPPQPAARPLLGLRR